MCSPIALLVILCAADIFLSPDGAALDQNAVIQNAVHALYSKIDAARHLLASNDDVSDSISAAALIRECSEALKALSSLVK